MSEACGPSSEFQRGTLDGIDQLPQSGSRHSRTGCLHRHGRDVQPPPRAPTARAMTSSEVIRAAVAWMPMRILARLVRGMVSVGLNALELVVDRYR